MRRSCVAPVGRRPVIPPGHDDVLGLVLVRAVQRGCDATAIMLVCRRWRDALLGRARGVTAFEDNFGLLARSPGILSLELGFGCTHLPWEPDWGSDAVLPPPLHLTKLTLWENGDGDHLRQLTVLRSLQSLSGPGWEVGPQAFAQFTALTELDLAGTYGTEQSSATVLSSVSHLRALASLSLGRAPLEADAPLDGLSALTTLTRFEVEWEYTEFAIVRNCDVSPLSHLRSLASLCMRGLTTAMTPQLSLLTALTKLTRLMLGWHRPRRAEGADLQHLSCLVALASLELSLHATLTPAQLSALSRLGTLTQLTLASVACSDCMAGYAFVSSLTNLRSFITDMLYIGHTSLANLRPLRQLTRLSLEHPGLLRPGEMMDIAAISGLRRLDLGGRIFDESFERSGLAQLTALGALEDLRLLMPYGGDLRCLLGLSWLTRLDLRGVEGNVVGLCAAAPCVSDLVSLRECCVNNLVMCVEFCAALGSLPNMRAIALKSCELGSGCLPQMSTLTALRLQDCAATAGVIASVSALQQLQVLEVRFSTERKYPAYNVSDALQRLVLVISTLRQLTSVALSGAAFPGPDLRPLARLPALRSVVVNDRRRWDLVTVWR